MTQASSGQRDGRTGRSATVPNATYGVLSVTVRTKVVKLVELRATRLIWRKRGSDEGSNQKGKQGGDVPHLLLVQTY